MSRLHKNVLIYLSANIAVASVPFCLLPILTRYLGPGGYGIVSMFTTVLPLLGVIIGLGVQGAVSRRWFDRDHIDIAKYVGSCLRILLVSSIVVILLFLLWGEWFSRQLSVPLFWLNVAVAVSVASFMMQIRLVFWQVQEKAVHYGLMQFGNALLNGFISFCLVVFFSQGFEGRLWGHTTAYIIIGILSTFFLYKDDLLTFDMEWGYVKDALSFGMPLIPHIIGGFFLLMADRMIVNKLLGTSYVGIYMVAVQIALGLNLINDSFNKAFVPRLFAKLKSGTLQDKKKIVVVTYLYILSLLTISLVSVFLSKYVISVFAGPRYALAASVLPWLILAQSFNGMYYLVTNYLFYEQKTHITSIITICCGSIGVFLSWFFVTKYGIIGAGFSSACSMFFQFVITWLFAARAYKMPWFFWRTTH